MRIAYPAAAALLMVSTSGMATVIARTCTADVSTSIGLDTAYSETVSSSGPPCAASAFGEGAGADNRHFPNGTYNLLMSTEYFSDLTETGNAFELNMGMEFGASGSAKSTLLNFPDTGYGIIVVGGDGIGSSLESFSVSSPYEFSLDFSTWSEGDRSLRSMSFGLSQNLLLGPNAGESIVTGLGNTGSLTGLLLPGHTYSIALDLKGRLMAGVDNGGTVNFAGSSGGLLSLKAVAVPEPATITLMLGAMGLFAIWAPRRRRGSARLS